MRLNWVFINTYKNLEAERIEFIKNDSNVYVVVGKNGSGKSNLLEAISMIFSSIYLNPTNPPFGYGICYEIDGKIVEIESMPFEFKVKVDDEEMRLDFLRSNNLLPNRVIAVYSGEELRMWEQVYKPFYDAYIDNLKSGNSSTAALNLYYVNKYHWNIALLTLALSETQACEEFIKELGYKVETVDFEFDDKRINENKELQLARLLEEIRKTKRYTIDELRIIFKKVMYGDDVEGLLLNDYDVFEYLQKGNIPKEFKTITSIKLNLSDNVTLTELSEGEKKKIMIFTVMYVLASQNSIVLLDEPDSFLHPSWQKNLIKYIDDLTSNNFTLLTTHSPNVLSGTDNDNVIRFQGGKVIPNTPPTWGRDINSIQFEVMGEYFREDVAEQEIKKIYELINLGDLDAAENAVMVLAENKLGFNDSEIIKMRTMIDFEREFQ